LCASALGGTGSRPGFGPNSSGASRLRPKFQPSVLFALARKKVPQAARDEAVQAARRGERITKSRAGAILSKHKKGKARYEIKTTKRVRPYLKNLLKKLSEEAMPGVVSELLCIVEELRESQATSLATRWRDPKATSERGASA
jgi:hypothetical protein